MGQVCSQGGKSAILLKYAAVDVGSSESKRTSNVDPGSSESSKKPVPVNSKRKGSFKGNMMKEYSTEIRELYVIEGKKILGSGASSEVVRIKHKVTGIRFALKTFFRKDKNGEKQRKYYLNEIEMLRSMDHPNVLRLFQAYEHNKNLHMVVELCSGGNLLRVLNNQPRRRVSELQAAQFSMQILRAINYLHENDIVHRDIKLENVMLERPAADAQIKLIDFGYATRHVKEDPPLTAFVGTAYATAPEVFNENYDGMCDMWGVGVITYAMLCGQRPFVGREVPNITNSKYRSMVADIISAHYSWPKSSRGLSNCCMDFVGKLLTVDIHSRMTSREALRHPFVAQVLDNEHFTENLAPLIPQLGEMSKFSDLKKNAMMAVAFSMSQAEMEDLRDCFTVIDTDHSGTLTANEFANAMKTVLPTIREDQIEEIFKSIDQDGNGEISYLEFLAATMHKNNLSMKELKDAFKILDHDGSGFLEPKDFEALLGESDANDKERIKRMLFEADTDGDGRVSFAEFVLAMGNVADIGNENEGVQLQALDAVALQDEKRKGRMKKLDTFKRHHSDSALQIENMRALDEELQAVVASPQVKTTTVSYRLKGQKSNEDAQDTKTRNTFTNNISVQVEQGLDKSVQEQNRAKIEMLRGSFSVSPSTMAGLKTPTFARCKQTQPDSESSGEMLQEHASSPSGFAPVNFTPPSTSPKHKKKSKKKSSKDFKLSPNNSGEKISPKNSSIPSQISSNAALEAINEIVRVEEKKTDEDSSGSVRNGTPTDSGFKSKTSGLFSSSASLELLVLHKSQGSNNEVERVGNLVGEEKDAEIPNIGLDIESSISAECA